MRELMLLRHAKSGWDDPGLDDADRPLAPRGERAAAAMGRMMAERGLLPDHVLCSRARRARDTWERVSAVLGSAVRMEIVPDLYDFGDGAVLLRVIRAFEGSACRLMLVGHNPSMEGLARRLATRGDPKLLARLAEKYPTGALAVIGFEHGSWQETGSHPGTLTRFIRPRDLDD